MENVPGQSSIELEGLKMPPIERPKKHNIKSSLRRAVDLRDDSLSYTVHLLPGHVFSNHNNVTPEPIETSNSHLVLQIYNHKKAKELAARRIHNQIERVRKRRLLLKKELFLECALHDKLLPDHSHSGSESNSSKVQNRLDRVKCQFSKNGSNTHGYNEYYKIDSTETFRMKIINRLGKQSQQHQQQLQKHKSSSAVKTSNHDDAMKTGNHDDEDNSYDSVPIKFISPSYPNGTNNSPRILNSSTKTGNPQVYEPYTGYVHRNKKILLTRKDIPSSLPRDSPPYNPKYFPPPGLKHKEQPLFHWADMDTGTLLLDKQISTLSISGNAI